MDRWRRRAATDPLRRADTCTAPTDEASGAGGLRGAAAEAAPAVPTASGRHSSATGTS